MNCYVPGFFNLEAVDLKHKMKNKKKENDRIFKKQI